MTDISNQQLLTAMTDQLSVITATMATKDDLKDLRQETKDDLKALRMATKSDIEGLRMATKVDLDALRSTMATKDDLVLLEATVASKMDLKQVQVSLQAKIRSGQAANIKHHLETRKAIGDLNRALSSL